MVPRALAAVLLLVAAAPARGGSFANFESGHVRPLALSPGGNRLFALNTPDNRLAIYTIGASGLSLAAEVPVGLEPVAVAARTNLAGQTEVWVVNHLSDSVSVVEIDPSDVTRSRVARTLSVGDEPRDIVFAGSGHGRAFVTAARRGQDRFAADPAGGPQLTAPGVGRADVWVFDADGAGDTPLAIVQLFGDTPRALAASPSGNRVYAAVFHSGNRTASINELAVCNDASGSAAFGSFQTAVFTSHYALHPGTCERLRPTWTVARLPASPNLFSRPTDTRACDSSFVRGCTFFAIPRAYFFWKEWRHIQPTRTNKPRKQNPT